MCCSAVCLDPIAHRYVTSVGVWLSKKVGGPEGFSPPYLHFYLLSPISVGLCITCTTTWRDRPCVRDRQRDDASWFNYVYNIALFLIKFFSLIAITLGPQCGREVFDF